MFYNYSISQLIGVLEWFGLVFALGTGVYFASVKATYMSFEGNKKSNIRVKSNVKKKQIFFDVA